MASYVKINDFVEHVAEKVHNLASDTLTVALSNTAPGSESTPPPVMVLACLQMLPRSHTQICQVV